MAEFKVDTDSEVITIDTLKIAPAEADNLKSAISFAGGMREFPGLPPFIEYEQFTVEFSEDGTLKVFRSGSAGEITFSFDTVDDLIGTIKTAVQISLDQKTLRPSPRHAGSLDMFNSGDVIEGR